MGDERSVAASEPGTDERSVAASEPGTDERSVAASEPGTDERSGFVTLIGRPNAGKSTLLNKILGFKVSIVSDKPQTTRTQIRGVLNRPGAQLVFVDTPGIHKPRTALGTSLNATANQASSEVDVVCFVLDGTARYGRGDASIAERLPKDSVIVVTKADIASPQQIAQQLAATAHLDAAQWFPLSGRTGEGIADLVDYLTERMPLGPRLYPAEMLTDVGDEFWVAELVREKLLALTPRRTASQPCYQGYRMGMAADPLRDPCRTRIPETDGDRKRRRGAQESRHRCTLRNRRRGVYRTLREGRKKLAASPRVGSAPRLLIPSQLSKQAFGLVAILGSAHWGKSS